MNNDQYEKIQQGTGFVAALDQSGGSTPKALKLYGVDEDEYAGDEEMFALMHAMRARIITSPSFDGDRILGVILFENTMDREIEGTGTADYLWSAKNIVPFLKVDQGLADEADGAQVMKPIAGLDTLLVRANEKGVFGTKMRRSSSSRTRRVSMLSSTSSSRSRARYSVPAWCRSSSPRSTSGALRRPRPSRS